MVVEQAIYRLIVNDSGGAGCQSQVAAQFHREKIISRQKGIIFSQRYLAELASE